MQNSSTVAAISTSLGKAALGIIRITGSDTFRLVSKCLGNSKKFNDAENRKIILQTFIENATGQIIDEVTVIKYSNPYSFTGEDMVEIICHGGISILKKIMKELKEVGIRGAEKGEFSKRAFLNGKMDLMKAEAIHALIESNNHIQSKIAINSYSGGYLKVLNETNQKLIDILAEVEAEIEFNEEDDIKENNFNINKIINIKNEIEKELSIRKKIKEVEKGIKVIIAGPANAGKSTLFNNIIGYERSIIFDEPGTTRDFISEKVTIQEKEITLIDSAGIRETLNKIENIGIEKSKREIDEAHLILWVSALNEKINRDEKEIVEKIKNKNLLVILSKSDIKTDGDKEEYYHNTGLEYIKVCLKDSENIKNIIDKIEEKINSLNNNIEIPSFIISSRQEEIVEEMQEEIESAINNWDRKEIVAYYLNNAMKGIEELLGRRDNELVYNKIFEKFCIGK